MLKQNGKIHYGVVIFIICFLFQFFVVTLQYHAPGQFVAPMAEEMGYSRSAITAGLSITTIASMVSMLFAGFVFKKYNLKIILCTCLVAFSSLYFLQSYATTITEVYIISAVRGLLSPFASMFPLTIVLNNWFGKRMIGKAVSYAMIGNSIGSIVMNPIIGYLIKNLGWRACYRIITFWPLAIVPVVLLFLVTTPEKKGLQRLGDVSAEEEEMAVDTIGDGVSSKEALKTSAFWIAALSLLLWSGTTQTWNLVGPPFLTDTGRDPVAVASVLSVFAFGNLLGKVVLGPFYDKNARNSLAAGYGVGMLAFILLILSTWLPFLAYVASFMMGFCIATVGPTGTIVTGALFGRKDFGVISSFMSIGGNIGSSLLPLLMNLVYTLVGSYITVWGIMAAFSVLSIALLYLAFARRPKKSIEET